MKLSAIVVLLVAGANSPAMGAPRSPVFMHLQEQMLAVAYQAGVAFEPKDWPTYAHPFPMVVQAILITESSACLFIHNQRTKTPIGCMQLHVTTASMIAGTSVSRKVLEQNWVLNIRIGAAFLAYCFAVTGKPSLAISCYHGGEFNYHWHDPYTARVIKIMDNLPEDTE